MKNNAGQTAVEYIFLLAVIVTVITSIFTIMKNKYLGDISKCQYGQSQQLLLCRLNTIVSFNPNAAKKFQYYHFFNIKGFKPLP